MNIQNITSGSTSHIQHNIPTILPIEPPNKYEPLTPEQKNTLQDKVSVVLTEKANEIRNNFSTAKDIDLTRAYYEQQQKLVDIYMQQSSEDQTNNSPLNVSKKLADTYTTLYQLHQNIREETTFLQEKTPKIEQKETELYNNLMMPTMNSYLNLQA